MITRITGETSLLMASNAPGRRVASAHDPADSAIALSVPHLREQFHGHVPRASVTVEADRPGAEVDRDEPAWSGFDREDQGAISDAFGLLTRGVTQHGSGLRLGARHSLLGPSSSGRCHTASDLHAWRLTRLRQGRLHLAERSRRAGHKDRGRKGEAARVRRCPCGRSGPLG